MEWVFASAVLPGSYRGGTNWSKWPDTFMSMRQVQWQAGKSSRRSAWGLAKVTSTGYSPVTTAIRQAQGQAGKPINTLRLRSPGPMTRSSQQTSLQQNPQKAPKDVELVNSFSGCFISFLSLQGYCALNTCQQFT